MEHQQPIVLRSVGSTDTLTPFAPADGSLDVVRVVDEDRCYGLFVLAGEIDDGTAPLLLEHLVGAARLAAVDLVIVDLLRVAWIGAPGTGALEAAWCAAARHGAQVVVCRPTGFVRRVLEATGLSALISPDADDVVPGS